MKKLGVLIAIVIGIGLMGAVPISARQVLNPDAEAAQKRAKQQQKAQERWDRARNPHAAAAQKLAKRQQKAMKAYVKAEQKAQRKQQQQQEKQRQGR